MKPIRLAIFAMCAAVVPSSIVSAETVAPKVQQAIEIQTTAIDLSHVSSDVMTYWLDPQHAPDAVQFRGGNPPKRIPLQVDASLVVLPSGIEKIIAASNYETPNLRNILIVRGTSDSIVRLRKMVAVLDKPVPQIEVEAKMLHLSKTAAQMLLGIQLQGLTISRITTSQRSQIEHLVATGQAKVVSAPRIQTFNKMQSEMTTVDTRLFEELKKNGERVGYWPAVWERKFTMLPTLNQSGTITLEIEFFESFVLNVKGSKFDSTTYLSYAPMAGAPKSQSAAPEKETSPPENGENLPAGNNILKETSSHQISTQCEIGEGGTLLLSNLGNAQDHSSEDDKTINMLLVTARVIPMNPTATTTLNNSK